jgi:acyl-CoA thioesterase-1
LIGDSISMGYTPVVQERLKGKANVHRIGENGGPTSNGVAKVDAWLGTFEWDVIHFNFGLHDLKVMEDGKRQVELEQYEANLRKIAARLKETGAKVIFATTTPVPEGKVSPVRRPEDVARYNEAAMRVMKEMGIEVNDLYEVALPKLKEIQRPVNVHFTETGYAVLGERVAARMERALER